MPIDFGAAEETLQRASDELDRAAADLAGEHADSRDASALQLAQQLVSQVRRRAARRAEAWTRIEMLA